MNHLLKTSPNVDLRHAATAARSPWDCYSASAQSHCWSAASGWPTRGHLSSGAPGRNRNPLSGRPGGQIRLRSLAESLLLSAPGGVGGVVLGIAVTTRLRCLPDLADRRPGMGNGGSLVATVLIGGVAGLYPAIRAARLSPTEAPATP
jgi:hypothetical protein